MFSIVMKIHHFVKIKKGHAKPPKELEGVENRPFANRKIHNPHLLLLGAIALCHWMPYYIPFVAFCHTSTPL
jgi:hypothetical protein